MTDWKKVEIFHSGSDKGKKGFMEMLFIKKQGKYSINLKTDLVAVWLITFGANTSQYVSLQFLDSLKPVMEESSIPIRDDRSGKLIF